MKKLARRQQQQQEQQNSQRLGQGRTLNTQQKASGWETKEFHTTYDIFTHIPYVYVCVWTSNFCFQLKAFTIMMWKHAVVLASGKNNNLKIPSRAPLKWCLVFINVIPYVDTIRCGNGCRHAGDAIFRCLTAGWKNSTRDGQFCLFYQKHEHFLHLLSETMKRAAATRTTESVFPCNRWVGNRNVQLWIDLSRC